MILLITLLLLLLLLIIMIIMIVIMIIVIVTSQSRNRSDCGRGEARRVSSPRTRHCSYAVISKPWSVTRGTSSWPNSCLNFAYGRCWLIREVMGPKMWTSWCWLIDFFIIFFIIHFPSRDSGLFGPNPWNILAPPSNYLSRFKLFGPNPWNKSCEGKYCDGNWA